jgi:E3 ubiquitin-protein ligase HERC1
MFEEFTQEERAKYLQFIWGRNKLPSDCSNLEYKHQLRYYSSHTTDKLPLTHTCFFQIDIPPYSSYEIMVARFKTAIEFCGEIDTD